MNPTPFENLFLSTFSFSYHDSDGRIVTVSRRFEEGAQVGEVASLFADLLRGAGYGVSDVVVKTQYGVEFSANEDF